MSISARDVVPFTKAGAGKIFTKNGEGHAPLIDADRLDCHHRVARERIHLLLIGDARRGLEDVVAARTQEADKALAALQMRRATTKSASKPVQRRDAVPR